MNIFGKTLMGATAATALAVAAPAQARDHDGIDGGDIVTGALVLGGLAAVIAATSDDDDRYDDRYDRRYGDRYDDRYDRRDRRHSRYNRRMSPRAAVNQCANAALQRASRYGRAQITEITDVDRDRRGYEVEGRLVVQENSWNRGRRWNTGYNDYDRGRFSCRIRNGRIDRVRVRGID